MKFSIGWMNLRSFFSTSISELIIPNYNPLTWKYVPKKLKQPYRYFEHEIRALIKGNRAMSRIKMTKGAHRHRRCILMIISSKDKLQPGFRAPKLYDVLPIPSSKGDYCLFYTRLWPLMKFQRRSLWWETLTFRKTRIYVMSGEWRIDGVTVSFTLDPNCVDTRWILETKIRNLSVFWLC